MMLFFLFFFKFYLIILMHTQQLIINKLVFIHISVTESKLMIPSSCIIGSLILVYNTNQYTWP